MTDNNKDGNKSIKTKLLQLYFLFVIIVGIVAVVDLVQIPGERTDPFLFGLTLERFLLVCVLSGLTAWLGWLFLPSIIRPAKFFSCYRKIIAKLSDNKIFGTLLILSAFGVLNGVNFRLWIPEVSEPVTLAYYIRLRPVFDWLGTISGLTLVIIHLLRYKPEWKTNRIIWQIFYPFTLTMGLFLTLWFWVSQSRYGIAPIDQWVGWIPLGIPILETQILLAWVLTMATLAFSSWLFNRKQPFRYGWIFKKEAIVWVVLWVVAFSVWMSEPLKYNWFASEPRPPNEESYPNSDASVYDITAQNLLLGEGFKTRGMPYTIRPMYGLLLAFFHKIGGLTYEPIIWMQVALLALIPVSLYAITERIHNRYSGIMAALLIILRERNAIFLGDTISDANAKLLMPFLPTTLGVLLFVGVMVAWLENPDRRSSFPLLSGGIVGIFMLIRPEFGILFPFVGLAAFFQMRNRRVVWAKAMGMVVVGLALALLPWLWRNYQITGTVFLDLPHYRLDLISRRFQETPVGFIDPATLKEPTETVLPTQTPTPQPIGGEVIEKVPKKVNPFFDQTRMWFHNALRFIQTHPAESISFITQHFMNSTVQTVQSLSPSYPMMYSSINFLAYRSVDQFWLDCCSLVDYHRRLPYWSQWDGVFHQGTILPMGVNLILIALGMSIAWVNRRFIGILPLFAAFGYILVNALVRNSGGRYIIPVNWIALTYLCIGAIQLTQWGISFFRKTPTLTEKPPMNRAHTHSSRRSGIFFLENLWIAMGIFLVGSSLPVIEKMIQPKLEGNSLAIRTSALLDPNSSFIDENEKEVLVKFLERNGVALSGFALYPRFHLPHQSGSVWYFHQGESYANFDFYLSSPSDIGIVLPITKSPSYFPHSSQVLVFACPQIPDFEALVVILYSADGIPVDVFWRDPMPNEPGCPLPLIE